MSPGKVAVALGTAVLTGAGFLVSAGTLHGSALVAVQAGIVALDAVAASYGVYLAPYKPSTPKE